MNIVAMNMENWVPWKKVCIDFLELIYKEAKYFFYGVYKIYMYRYLNPIFINNKKFTSALNWQ